MQKAKNASVPDTCCVTSGGSVSQPRYQSVAGCQREADTKAMGDHTYLNDKVSHTQHLRLCGQPWLQECLVCVCS